VSDCHDVHPLFPEHNSLSLIYYNNRFPHK
jgi:hypothetical protein